MRALACLTVLVVSGCQCLVPVDEDLDAGVEDAGLSDSGTPDAGRADGGHQPTRDCIEPSDCEGSPPPLSRWCGVFGGDGGTDWSCVDHVCVAQCAGSGGQTCTSQRGVECLRCPPSVSCVPPSCGGGFEMLWRIEELACVRDAGLTEGMQLRETVLTDAGCGLPLYLQVDGGEVLYGHLYLQSARGLSARIDALGGTCLVTDLPTGAPRMLVDCPSCQLSLGP